MGIDSGVLTADPLRGEVLLFSHSGAVHEYDVPTNLWSTLPSTIQLWAPDSNKVAYRVAVPILTYGLIALLTTHWRDATSQVLLYRHPPGSGAPVDAMPPAPPAGVRLQ